MPLILWLTTSEQLKLKQYEIITKPRLIKLKEDRSNFIEWKEQIAKHYDMTDLDTLLCYGSTYAPEGDDSHPVHSRFETDQLFFNIYRQISMSEMRLLSDKLWNSEDVLSQYKDDCLTSYIFGSVKSELQKKLA